MFSDSMISKITSENSIIGYALEVAFPSGTSRTHSGVGEILIDGEIYYGVGELGSVGTVDTVGDSNPTQLAVSLNGLPGPLLNEALQAQARGSDATLYVIVFDVNGQLLQAEASFVGFVTNYQVSAGDENRIDMTIGDEFELYEMPWYEYWTDGSHTVAQPNDRFCKYTAQMGDREINWGSERDAPTFDYVS